MRDWKRVAALAVSALALADVARAQQTPQQPSAADAPSAGIQVFQPDFFARFSPVTAEDMVRQLPGFTIDEGEDLRGFAATAGNVLIDGQRPPSKAEISKELGRIAARDVLRIELIGAAAAGNIDVRGYTELANVVLKPATKMQESTTWAITTRAYEQGRQGAQIGATRSWKTDDFGFRLNVQGTSLGEREEVESLTSTAAGTPVLQQSEFYQQQFGELLVTGTGNWTPTPRDTYNVNFRVMPRTSSLDAAADVRLANGTPASYIALDYTEKDIWYVDVGGDWEHRFSAGNSIKLTSVNNTLNWRPQQSLTQVPLLPPIPQVGIERHDDSDNKAANHVVRGVWTLKPNAGHTVDIGLEGAYTYREVERTSELGFIGGPFAPVAVPVASTKVEEERIEASITDVWRISQQLTLESGINYEASTISQSGDAVNEREFTYPKPRIVATWTPNAQDQIRISLVRDVSQLDFGDFATGLDSISTTANVGNPDLEPEQTWKFSAQWKRPIGQRGSFSITGFYDDIEDVQDFISPSFAPTRTAVGNIGDGERWGGRIEATLPLDSMGITNGILKVNAGGQESSVADPLTGAEREISNEMEYDWAVDFRQDIPTWKFAWGGKLASYLPVLPGASIATPPNTQYRIDRIEITEQGDPSFDMFVETTRFLGGALVRLTAANLLDAEKEVERQVFTPSRVPPGVFTSTELRNSTYGRTLTLTIAGAF